MHARVGLKVNCKLKFPYLPTRKYKSIDMSFVAR